MNERTAQIIASGIVLVLLALIGVTYKSCDQQYDRRADCIKGGQTANDCRTLFPAAGRE